MQHGLSRDAPDPSYVSDNPNWVGNFSSKLRNLLKRCPVFAPLPGLFIDLEEHGLVGIILLYGYTQKITRLYICSVISIVLHTNQPTYSGCSLHPIGGVSTQPVSAVVHPDGQEGYAPVG